MSGEKYLQQKYFITKILICSNITSTNDHTTPKCKCYSRTVVCLNGNFFTTRNEAQNLKGIPGFSGKFVYPFKTIANLALRKNFYFHKNFSTNKPSFRIKSLLLI